MSAHGPDERLSAFCDGELSAVERAEVERLLTERPNLRAELSAITDLSQRLSDLADDFPDTDLRPRVMQRIAALRPAVAVAIPQAMRRRGMPLLLSVCSLSLLLAAVWPLRPHSRDSGMLAKTDSAPAAPLSGVLFTPFVTSAEMTGADAIPSELPMAMEAKSMNPKSADAIAGSAVASESASDQEAEMSLFLTDLVKSRELNPGEVIRRVIDGNESSLIAEYTVVDVRRGAHDVGIVLQQNGIIPLATLVSPDKVDFSKSDRATDSKSTRSVMVYVVEAESEPLNNALFRCEALKEVVTSNVEPLSPYGPVNSTVASDEAGRPSNFDSPAPAEAPASRVMQRKSGDPPASERDDVPSKDNSTVRKALPAERLAEPSRFQNQPDQTMAEVDQKTAKETQPVFGHSFLVENGDELMAELDQRQSQLSQSSHRLNSMKPNPISPNEPFSLHSRRATPDVNFLQQKAYNAPSRAGQAGNGLQDNSGYYTNGLNGFRSRQRAILVLRPQSPSSSPPPGPAPAEPQGG